MLEGQQTVFRTFPDLLGCRARPHGALTQCPGHHRSSLLSQGAGQHTRQRRTHGAIGRCCRPEAFGPQSKQSAGHCCTTQHAGNRLTHRSGDRAGAFQGCLEGFTETVCDLDVLVVFLLGIREPGLCDPFGVPRAVIQFFFEELTDPPTCWDVSQANKTLWQPDGALDRHHTCIAQGVTQ